MKCFVVTGGGGGYSTASSQYGTEYIKWVCCVKQSLIAFNGFLL
jgi:hypothetical protein